MKNYVKTESKKILYIAVSSQTGGVPKHILNALNYAKEQGYDITVAVPNDGDYYAWFQEAGAKMINLRLKPYSFSALLKLNKLVKEQKYQLVHSHGKGAGMYARPLKVLNPSIKVVHTFHGIYVEAYKPLFRRVYCTIEHMLKHWTDIFLCVSESEKEESLRLKFVFPERVRVICNGVNPNLFRNIEIDRRKYLKEWGFPEEAFVIGCVARLERMKGHPCLIQAFAQVQRKYPKSRLLLVGDGPDRVLAEQEVKSLGLEDKVCFAGFRHDIPQVLTACDIFVSASLKEGMPYTLIEAQAAGVPVVATDVIGNKDVIVDHETGLLVPAENPQKMAEAIVYMIEHQGHAKMLAKKGQNRVDSYFTVDSVTRQLFDIYKELMK